MANEFIGGGVLQGILNPQGIDIQRAVQPLAAGIQRFTGRQRQEGQKAEQLQQLQQQQLQQQESRRDAAFASSLIGVPVDVRNSLIEHGLQSGMISPDFAQDIEGLQSLDIGQQDIVLKNLLTSEGFESFIPAKEKISTATLSPGERLVETQTGREIAKGAADTSDATKLQSEIRKETRGGIRTELKDISKQAGVIKQNYNKVQNLAKEVAKGNRISASQALVALVKLGDPGSVVSGNEVNTALNAPNPLAAMTEMLTSKGVSGDVVQAVAQRIDPLNPKNINTKDLLATANALVSANIPTIQSRFEEAKTQGTDNLSQAGFKSIFSKGLESRVSGLSELAGPSAEAQQSGVEQTATNPQTGERLVLRNGQWQPL